MFRHEGLLEFVRVVEAGSFTRAAEALGASKSNVSNRVRALEDRLGARLLNRTTRKLAATRFRLFASAAYLDRAGTPRAPEDLARHRCITFGQHGSNAPATWRLRRAGDRRALEARVSGGWRSEGTSRRGCAAWSTS